jgi:hypothetical protein
MAIPLIEIPLPEHIKLKVERSLRQYNKLLKQLQGRPLQPETEQFITHQIATIKTFNLQLKPSSRKIDQSKRQLLSYLQKNEGIYAKNHFMTLYMAVGMTAIGLPAGIIFSFIVDNTAFIGVGLPVGLSIGLAVGRQKDLQIKAKGKQINYSV